MTAYPYDYPAYPEPWAYPGYLPQDWPMRSWTPPAEPSMHGQPQDNVLLDRLAKAINGEHNAIRKYHRLAQLAPTENARRIIQSIREDEVGHFKRFSQYYASMTGGRQPQVTDQPLPEKYLPGVEESIRDELEDSKFYQDTALLTRDRMLIRTLMNASHDEARHATWFLYLYHNGQR